MSKKSAGILLYRIRNSLLEVFLVHPGGPFWTKKDLGAWSIPKGEFDNENPLQAAKREFSEETGNEVQVSLIALTPVKQKSGKIIYVFAGNQDINEKTVRSNSFSLEWPPKSGKKIEFPEVDKGSWFDIQTAKEKLNKSQISLIDELIVKISGREMSKK
jgi:predicted NUDIX family NTP pyrophosphohydrolase